MQMVFFFFFFYCVPLTCISFLQCQIAYYALKKNLPTYTDRWFLELPLKKMTHSKDQSINIFHFFF